MALGIPRNALWRNYSFHGGDLILVLIEFIINTMPFISSHILIVYVVCLLYMGEAFVVYRVNGFWMYPFLDTTVGPIWVAYYIGVGFVIMCAFFLMYFLHRLRDRSPKQKKQQNQDHSSDLQQSQHQGEDSQNHSAYDIGEPSIDGYKDQEEINGDLDSKNANKNRSRSDSSVSTTSTLVGNDEVGPKDQERERPLSRKASRRMSFLGDLPSIILGTEHPNHLDHAEESSTPTERLEIVEEGNETETEDSEENHL
ncbi:hypothetical protein BGX27_001388 [Mortierella sp. AM989]|nr:hypothetical protein BGX27_001388 [Mortierella sp. AM989]